MTSPDSAHRYHIIDLIAVGGMAEVYRGETSGPEGFRKRVAIKRVLPHLARDQKFLRLFLDEARLCARLSHANCVNVFDVGQSEGAFFLVMEYVDGGDLTKLRDRLRELGEPFPVAESVRIIEQVCVALAYAHGATDERGKPLNIVHRDVSPANVLITRSGEVKLADFGLAKAAIPREESEKDVVKGKFRYLAPETLAGKPIDGRADLFATGAVLWELLSGGPLFSAEHPLAIIDAIRKAEIPPLAGTRPGIDDALDAILARALARDPADRYADAREMAKALSGWLVRAGLDVGPFELARLVQRYRDNPAKGNLIGDMLRDELAQQVAAMRNLQLAPPNWEDMLPGLARPTPLPSEPEPEPLSRLAPLEERDPTPPIPAPPVAPLPVVVAPAAGVSAPVVAVLVLLAAGLTAAVMALLLR